TLFAILDSNGGVNARSRRRNRLGFEFSAGGSKQHRCPDAHRLLGQFFSNRARLGSKVSGYSAPHNFREYMQRPSARPHHVGSTYDKDNAEWIFSQFKQWGLDARIETFDVLFPTPKERVVELVEPKKFVAKLQEPALQVDLTSNQQSEQLPIYNAYS